MLSTSPPRNKNPIRLPKHKPKKPLSSFVHKFLKSWLVSDKILRLTVLSTSNREPHVQMILTETFTTLNQDALQAIPVMFCQVTVAIRSNGGLLGTRNIITCCGHQSLNNPCAPLIFFWWSGLRTNAGYKKDSADQADGRAVPIPPRLAQLFTRIVVIRIPGIGPQQTESEIHTVQNMFNE